MLCRLPDCARNAKGSMAGLGRWMRVGTKKAGGTQGRVVCSNTDGPRDCHREWRKPDKEGEIQNRNRLSDLESELMAASREGWWEEIVREFGIDLYTLLNLKCKTSKDLLCSTGDSARCHAAAWMGRGVGETGYTYMYGWVPLLLTWSYHNIVTGLYSNTK